MFCIRSILADALIHGIGMLPLRAGRALGAGVGALAYRLNLRITKISRENLGICLPDISKAERERLTLTSLQETAKTGAEICRVWSQPASSLEALICCTRGGHLIESALAKGKGLLVLGPHLGNWEILGLQLASYAKVTSMYQPLELEGLNRIILQSRTKTGCTLVPTTPRGVSSLLRALKNNEIGGILPDQVPNDMHAGRFVPFFREPALTMVLIHKLLQRSGCRAVFAYAKRVEKGFELVFQAPPEALYCEDEELSLKALNQGVEALVMDAPEQYQWEYKRFKRRSPEQTIKRYQYK